VLAHRAFEYAILRVVPHVEREEFVNAGVVVFCDAYDYLGAKIALDEARLVALAPSVDVELVREHLAAVPVICAGGQEAGPIGRLSPRERWQWLVAPRSTILQASAAHAGMCDVPEAWLERIVEAMVRTRRAG
jgi:hypothetical protein